MSINIEITLPIILFSSAAILALVGTLIIMRAERKKVPTVTETPIDRLGPILTKNHKIDPRIIAKRNHYDPHNRKMERWRRFGIFLLILVPIITIIALLIQ